MLSGSTPISSQEHTIGSFYEAFPYPWRPMYFETISDPQFYPTLIRQEMARPQLSEFRDIWVAGCGTNQALITALQFPNAHILGTDVSARSLEICENNAKSVGVSNLKLEQQGIMQSNRDSQFDMVICTGVIHHNREPRQCLSRLSAALRDDGVLELMVYNKFHRREVSAFQGAVRILLAGIDSHRERLSRSRSLARSIEAIGTMGEYLHGMQRMPDEVWADNCINPYETSYDLDSLWSMAEESGLTIEVPRINVFDKAKNRFLWTLDISDPYLSDAFFSLDDRPRWQVVNLLRLDTSPMLWFILRPDRDGTGTRVSEADRNRIFLDSVLEKPSAVRHRYVLDDDGTYKLSSHGTLIREMIPKAEMRAIWDRADGKRTVREIFAELDLSHDFNVVYKARLMLTSAEFPHLVAHMPPWAPQCARGL